MIASEIIAEYIIPLRISDSGNAALMAMNDLNVKHLPVLDMKGNYMGLLSENDLLDHPLDLPINLVELEKNYVRDRDHLFEIMKFMAEKDITAIPVLDKENKYLGCISIESLLKYYASGFSFTEPGSILVIQMDRRNYSLVEISKIIEAENSRILSSFVSVSPDSQNVLVTIKINSLDSSRIVSIFEKYDYKIIAEFSEEPYFESMKERYDALMNYLNV